MTTHNMPPVRYKAAVSVTEMARMVSLSRRRFTDLTKRGVFVFPIYSLATKRPFFTAEMQQDNLAARQTGIGCNGQYVLFYERRSPAPPPQQKPAARSAHAELIEGLKGLGMTVTGQQVEQALAACFPGGTVGIDEAVVLRAVYRHLRRANPGT